MKKILPAPGLFAPETTVFWFRRDLRVKDNRGLFHALRDHGNVLPVFIFDPLILNALEDRDDRRVQFIHESLVLLKASLEEAGGSLLVLHGDPQEIFSSISPKTVCCNHDYEPYAHERDQKIAGQLARRGINFHSWKDQVILEKDEVVKDDGKPYTVYTPYSRKWLATLREQDLAPAPSEKHLDGLLKLAPLPMPSLEDIGFNASAIPVPERKVSLGVVRSYDTTRDLPSIAGTTRLGVHLRFGTVSIRQLVTLARKENKTWLNELIWREFYQMILWHFPQVTKSAFKPAYDRVEWRNDPAGFDAWCKGMTGYPMVDAGMRELAATGFMHNRARMVVASFLTKHLLIDWRLGEAWFARKLLDFELASNNGGWQWAAGCGCDAAPYFRVFNPQLQLEKFDPDLKYVRKWVPEVETPDYPRPLVDHKFARDRVIRVYQEALKGAE